MRTAEDVERECAIRVEFSEPGEEPIAAEDDLWEMAEKRDPVWYGGRSPYFLYLWLCWSASSTASDQACRDAYDEDCGDDGSQGLVLDPGH